MTKTVMIGLTCVSLFLAGPAGAQYFDPNPYGSYEDRERHETWAEQQERMLDDAMRGYPRQDPLVDYYQRRDAMRQRAIDACNFIDRNPAARSACLEGLR